MCSMAISVRTSEGGLIALDKVIYFESCISEINQQFFIIKDVSEDGNIIYLAKVNKNNGIELRCSCEEGFPYPSFRWSEPFQNIMTEVMGDNVINI